MRLREQEYFPEKGTVKYPREEVAINVGVPVKTLYYRKKPIRESSRPLNLRTRAGQNIHTTCVTHISCPFLIEPLFPILVFLLYYANESVTVWNL